MSLNSIREKREQFYGWFYQGLLLFSLIELFNKETKIPNQSAPLPVIL